MVCTNGMDYNASWVVYLFYNNSTVHFLERNSVSKFKEESIKANLNSVSFNSSELLYLLRLSTLAIFNLKMKNINLLTS